MRAALVGELVQTIDGAEELLMCGRAEQQIERLERLDRELTKLARRDAAAVAVAETLGGVITGARAARRACSPVSPACVTGLLPGVLLAALAFLFLASYEAVAPLPAAARSLRACGLAAERVEDVCDVTPVSLRLNRRGPSRASARFRVEHLFFRYEPEDPWVLEDLSLTLAPGERVALLGRSGAGKSTLGELLVRFRDAERGAILLDGTDVRELSPDGLRSSVLLCGQDAHLFNTTIRENLLIARRHACEEDLAAVLETVELTGWVASLPDGLDTRVGAEGSELSGGQRQRLALARALLSEARFLILDEPTAHLEDDLAARIGARILARSPSPQALLVITHDPALAAACDRVLEVAPPVAEPAQGVGKTRNPASGFPGLRGGAASLA